MTANHSRHTAAADGQGAAAEHAGTGTATTDPVSYTHLTLPTILLV